MGFLDSGSKKEAKFFLRVEVGRHGNLKYFGLREYEELWRDTPIAEREKILKEHFSADSGLHFDSAPVAGGRICDFGKKVVKNPEKEAKKEFSELPEILRADIIQLVYALGNRLASREELANQDRKAVQEDAARLRRMDESNQGRGLSRSGNVRFTDTWKIGEYSVTCTVEYWARDDTANAYWSVVTDKKFGGPSIPCYVIKIEIYPMPEDYLLKEIHGWIRHVRPFKGLFYPGDIFQHWKTHLTGQEEEILAEIRIRLLYGFAEVRYEKQRTDTQLTAIKEKAEKNLLRLKKQKLLHQQQKYEEWVRSGGPEIRAEIIRQEEAVRKYAEEAAELRAVGNATEIFLNEKMRIARYKQTHGTLPEGYLQQRLEEERVAAAAAKEIHRQESFTKARYEKQAKAGSWWNSLSENEKKKCIESKNDSYYEKVLDGDLGAIPKPTQNFDEIFDSAKDIVVDWWLKSGVESSTTEVTNQCTCGINTPQKRIGDSNTWICKICDKICHSSSGNSNDQPVWTNSAQFEF